MARCAWCGRKFPANRIGRPRAYCSTLHRQYAYQARRLWREMKPDDLHMSIERLIETKREARTVHHAVAEAERQAVWEALRSIAFLKPGTRDLVLEMARKEPSPEVMASLRKLFDI